jgi:hypothetical protein
MILTPQGYKEVSSLRVGDKLISLDVEELTTEGLSGNDLMTWSSDTFTNNGLVETEIVSIVETTKYVNLYQINSDWFTSGHDILVRKDERHFFLTADQIDETYEVFSHATQDWKQVESVDSILDSEQTVYSIDCEPHDIFFTQDALVYNIREN